MKYSLLHQLRFVGLSSRVLLQNRLLVQPNGRSSHDFEQENSHGPHVLVVLLVYGILAGRTVLDLVMDEVEQFWRLVLKLMVVVHRRLTVEKIY